MPKLYVFRGLPGSGKSTWTAKCLQVANSKDNVKMVRVNKDMLRDMLSAGEFGGSDEHVNEILYKTIAYYLSKGMDVISDNMNLDPKHWDEYQDIVAEVNEVFGLDAKIYVIDFETPIEKCIERDKFRVNQAYIGADTIHHIANKYLIHDTENGFFPLTGTYEDRKRF